jgi:D-arabinose 1-dehydrogenase-like Zn-dependent alcohol dehydrogenase
MKSFRIETYGAPLKEFETQAPQPQGSEILLKVRAAGVCHTDLHIWDGGYDMGGGKMLKMADRGQTLPHTMGHETVGEVVAFGPQCTGVKAGDVRLIYPWIGCGQCAVCRADTEQLCPNPRYLGVFSQGGYADHIVVPHPRYLIDIGAMTPEQAAPYACSGLTAFSALKKVGKERLAEPILITGAGGLGLMCLSLLKAMGGRGAVVSDPDPAKREAALKAGALATVDPTAADAPARIAKAVGGPLWAVIDFVGAPASWGLAFATLSKGGYYVVVGLYGGETMLSLPAIPLRALTVFGSFVGSRPELIELIALAKGGKVQPIPITKRPLRDVNTALLDLKHGRQVGRAVLVP